MAIIITFHNHKGGSGKTHCAVNTAAALAIQGYRTLLVDSDSQCNATAYLDGSHLSPTLLDVYRHTVDDLPCYQTSLHQDLWLAPGSKELMLVDNGKELEWLHLRHAMKDLNDAFDYILIDTPPAAHSVLVNNAMIASDWVLTPLDVDGAGGLQGLPQVLESVNEMGLHNTRLRWLGLVYNKVQDTWASGEVTDQSKSHLKENSLEKHIFKTQIRYLTRYGSSAILRKPIVFMEGAEGIGAAQFIALAKELVKRTSTVNKKK